LYSDKIIATNLSNIIPKLKFTPHFKIEKDDSNNPISYISDYSDAETQRYVDYLKGIYDPELGRLTRDLTSDERDFISSERILARTSFPHFFRNYSTIINNDGQIVHPQPSLAQKITVAVWSEMEELLLAILVLQLKGRQLGVTTLVGQAILHRTLFYRQTFSYIASSDEDNTRDKMGSKMVLTLINLPWYLLPSKINGPFESGETLFECPTLGSYVMLQHGRQKKGIGRGDSTTCVHLSELSEFQNPQLIVDAALLKSFHPTPRHFMVLEYTGSGIGNWSHKLWTSAKENWPKRRSFFNPIFLPFYVDQEFWPTVSWLRQHNLESKPEVPSDWMPEPRTIAMSEKAADYVRSKDYLSKYLGTDWKMPVEKMFFWEQDRAEHERKGELNVFYGEMALDDISCFASKKHGIFNAELIETIQLATRSPVGIYGVQGDKVSADLTPDITEFDATKNGYAIKAGWGDRDYNFKLTPIKYRNYPDIVFDNRLIVYEEPRSGYDYALGIDTGDGIGRNLSTIEVLRTRVGEPDMQVAEYASAWAGALDMWPHALSIGTWYSAPKRQQCRIAIECAGTGDALQNDLRLSGWSNFHVWIRLDTKIINKARSRKIGWYTYGWSRRLLMEFTIKAVKAGWVILNSPWLITELGQLETDSEIWMARADNNDLDATDDRYIGMGIAYMSLHELDKQKGEYTPSIRALAPPVISPPDTNKPIIDLLADTLDDYGNEDDLSKAAGW
jgi:hypothetical protein